MPPVSLPPSLPTHRFTPGKVLKISSECNKTGLPNNSKNCLGRSAFMRFPTPPARSTTETPSIVA